MLLLIEYNCIFQTSDIRQCLDKSIALHEELCEDGLKAFTKQTLKFCHGMCIDDDCSNACFLSHFVEKCKDIDQSLAFVCKKASSDFTSQKDCAALENECKTEFYKSVFISIGEIFFRTKTFINADIRLKIRPLL